MSRKDWSFSSLTDSDLSRRLGELGDDEQYEELDLFDNRLTRVPDLSKYRQFHNLKRLWLGGNNISEIDGSHLPSSVRELRLGSNHITSVKNLTHCTGLTDLGLQYNKISEIDGSHLPSSVRELRLENNHITSVKNLSHCTGLTELWLQYNNISEIEGSLLPSSVRVLRLENNRITSVKNLTHCTGLTDLWLQYNNISEIEGSLLPSSVRVLRLENNVITSVKNLTHCTGLTDLGLQYNKISEIDGSHLPSSVRELRLYNNVITSVKNLSHCTNLTDLGLQYNKISEIDGSHLPSSVRGLRLENNVITSVKNLSHCTGLTDLGLQYNKISEIDGSHLPSSVRGLRLGSNLITSVKNLTHCTGLTDLRLQNNKISEIDGSHLPSSVRELRLEHNVITSVKNLSHCTNLTDLGLQYNKISEIDGSHLPSSVRGLRLENNVITSVKNLSHCTNLTDLGLQYNKISEIDGSHLPSSVRGLRLENNVITSVKNLSHCTNLTDLGLQYNKISEIDGSHLPSSVRELRLYNNVITSVKNLTHQIIESITEVNIDNNDISELPDFSHHTNLVKLYARDNPQLSAIQGIPANLEYMDLGFKVKVLGKQCFHEENYMMLRQCNKKFKWELEQPPVEVMNQGFEAIMDYFEQNSIRTTQTSLMLLGPTEAGKSSMIQSLITGMSVLIHIHDRTQVAKIETWNITPTDSIQTFDHGGHEIYGITTPLLITKNGLIALVHDITKTSDRDLNKTRDIMLHALQYHPENRIILVLTHTDLCEHEQDTERNCARIKAMIHEVLEQEIGGLSRNISQDEKTSTLATQLKKQKDNMEVFLLSSKTRDGMDILERFLRRIITENKRNLPEKWVEFYTLFSAQGDKFSKVINLELSFEQLYPWPVRALQKSKILRNFTSALEYYRTTGHILYYPETPVLKDYVFHDKTFLLDIFKSCFHHNPEDAIDFTNMLIPESHAKLMIRQYQDEGLLSVELRKHLWSCYGLDKNEERAVLEIMKQFHLCYPIDAASDLLFFPWFVKSKQPPASLNVDKLGTISQKHFSVELECVFTNRIPVNAFEALQVQIQKIALDKHNDESGQAWHHGIVVKIGTLEVIAVRKPSDKMISVCVRGHISDIKAIWQVVTDVNLHLDSKLQPLIGVIRKIYFRCNHCVIRGLIPVGKWSVEIVLNNNGPDVSYFSCRRDEIPKALVIAPNNENERNDTHMDNLRQYLESTCKDMSPPNKVLYLDCEEVGENQYHLSWCLPGHEDEIGPIPEISHSVVESRQGQIWSLVADGIREQSYRVECIAEEFRVAAVNKNGAGGFSNVTPFRVLRGDEMISESDRQHMRDNHVFFTRMTSVQGILIRLLSRRVISEEDKKYLIRQPNAADKLMERVIYKTDYRKLYLFQKTLREFGQSVLADIVPVQIQLKSVHGASCTTHSEDGQSLCDDCKLTVANKTLELQHVIDVLACVGRDFCVRLNLNIITTPGSQRIQNSVTDADALHHIRKELRNSLQPDKVDELIKALSVAGIDKTIHAQHIKDCYYSELKNHKRCEKCPEG